jgi:hypothetical protein
MNKNYIEEILDDIRKKQIDEESKGIVYLKNGIDIFIDSHYLSIQNLWLRFKKALYKNDKEILKEIYERFTMNGVLTNGVFFVDIKEITGMIEISDEDLIEIDEFN